MGKKRYVAIWLVLSLFLLVGCSGCGISHSEQFFDRSGVAMDTTISLRAAGGEAQQAIDESFASIEKLDRLASTNNPNSDVSKINRAAGKDYVSVDPMIYEMIALSKAYAAKSNGSFDITVGIFTRLWDIGNPDQHIPSPKSIRDNLQYVNYQDILLRPTDHAVKLAKSGMYIDLGGVAKGYAVDVVRDIYKRHHVQQGLINLGSSSMFALGKNAKQTEWNIGIKHPRSDEDGNYLGIIKIENQFLSTSGDYERYFIKNGVRYHHIFDPKTGYPARSGVISDSIIIQEDIPHSGILSDILTTVVFVLGPQKGLAFIQNMPGVECEITGENGILYMTEGFKQRTSDINQDFRLSS